MLNLREETIRAVEEAGQSPEQIVYIGDRKSSCTWPEFLYLAGHTYDDSYGRQIVNSDLVITFKDRSWLERAEYDGSEWWSYKKCYRKPRGQVSENPLKLFTRDLQ